jgi:glycosyltransferase involved in cell wall biosynthesis
MKLGIIVNSPSPHQKSLLDALVSLEDVDVLIAYSFRRNPQRTWGVPKVIGKSVMVPWKPGPGCIGHLTDWIRSSACDVWILGSVFTALRTQALVSALGRAKKPWVFLGEPPRPRSGWRAVVRNRLLNRVMNKCDGVIATGMESARRYQKLLGDNRPVTSVPYYIPLDEWLELPLVEPLQPNEPVRFVTLAQLIPRKGLDVLIEACRQLPSYGWTLDIYGEGPERSQLQQSVRQSGLPITIHQPLPFESRTIGFRGKHCFVFPTRWDGWGMVVVEALAAGLPVISTDQAMSAHDFINESNGRLVPADEKHRLGQAMCELMADRETLPRYSVSARNAVHHLSAREGAVQLVHFAQRLKSTVHR